MNEFNRTYIPRIPDSFLLRLFVVIYFSFHLSLHSVLSIAIDRLRVHGVSIANAKMPRNLKKRLL